MKPQTIYAIAVALLIFAVMLWFGTWDYQDQQIEQQHACQMVHGGAWPKSFCEDGK